MVKVLSRAQLSKHADLRCFKDVSEWKFERYPRFKGNRCTNTPFWSDLRLYLLQLFLKNWVVQPKINFGLWRHNCF